MWKSSVRNLAWQERHAAMYIRLRGMAFEVHMAVLGRRSPHRQQRFHGHPISVVTHEVRFCRRKGMIMQWLCKLGSAGAHRPIMYHPYYVRVGRRMGTLVSQSFPEPVGQVALDSKIALPDSLASARAPVVQTR